MSLSSMAAPSRARKTPTPDDPSALAELLDLADESGDPAAIALAHALEIQHAEEHGIAAHPEWVPDGERERVDARRRELVGRVRKYGRDRQLAAARATLAARRAERAKSPASTKRPAGRAPRRPRAAPARRVQRAEGDGDDGPAPRFVDQYGASTIVAGWSGRAFVAFVKKRGIAFTKIDRRYVVRVGDVLGALGLSDAPQTTAAPSDFGSAAYVERRLRVVRGGRS